MLPHLRHTLKGFEINSKVKILSNHSKILKRFFSEYPNTCLLHLIFVTGFSYAESNFLVVITKSKTFKVG